MIGRRGFLLGTAAAATAALTGCGTDDAVGIASSGSFRSRYRHASTGWTIVRPDGHGDDRLPVLVALHGRTGDHEDAFGGSLHLDRVLADVVRSGTPPFAIASVDGGDHDYWHPRSTTDPAGMVIHEFLPLLARHGLDVERLGFMGWSMGGYGALYLASVLRRRRVAAVIAESPAIWHTAAQRVEGSFDSDAQFDRDGVFGRLRRLAGIPLWLDCGASDGFWPVTRDLRAAVRPTPAGGITAGGHDSDYWRGRAPAQLRWAGRQLHRSRQL